MNRQGGVAMVVIDMQRQFTDPTGIVAVPDGQGLVARLNDVVRASRRAAVPVIWIEQRVREGLPLSPTSERFAAAGLHQGHWADLDPGLDVAPGDFHIIKRQQSAFHATDLALTLRRLGVRRVLLAGVTTNVCVLATAKDVAEHDLEVVTLGDLTASRAIARGSHQLDSDDVQRSALAFIDYAYGEVLSSDQLPWH